MGGLSLLVLVVLCSSCTLSFAMATCPATLACPTAVVNSLPNKSRVKDKRSAAQNYMAGAMRIMMKRQRDAEAAKFMTKSIQRVEKVFVEQMTQLQCYLEEKLVKLELTMHEEIGDVRQKLVDPDDREIMKQWKPMVEVVTNCVTIQSKFDTNLTKTNRKLESLEEDFVQLEEELDGKLEALKAESSEQASLSMEKSLKGWTHEKLVSMQRPLVEEMKHQSDKIDMMAAMVNVLRKRDK